MERVTLNQILLDGFRRYDKPDLLWTKRAGRWEKISTRTFLHRAARLARSLQQLGIQKGDRVGLFSENRPEWHIADFAVLGLGAITVPVYPAESAERLRYILQHSEARLCFVSRAEQLETVVSLWDDLAHLEGVIPFEPVGGEAAPRGGHLLPWESVVSDKIADEELAQFEELARSHQPDDVASLIYTSGTTGTPKGALLTQHNFASNINATLGLFTYGATDLALCLLPLSHIYERKMDYGYLAEGTSIAYAESLEKVVENLREVRPTFMAVVPRFFEKFYARLQERVRTAPQLRQKIFHWAVDVGREALPYLLPGKPFPPGLWIRYRLADQLVYRKVRAELGGRLRCMISGSAPLARGLNEFFHALGMRIFEGYGLTETSPVISVNLPGANKLGTVGPPIPGVEVKIAEDGEILTRGPHVMKGYYKMAKETEEAFREGWFCTGDVGFLDPDGFLTVTDRKKDLIKTAGGKYIAPQPIENSLKQSPYIQNAVVLGDRRRFAVALLVPNFATLEHAAQEQSLTVGSREDLLVHPQVQALVAAEVEGVNRHLAQYEKIKRFALLDQDFSFDKGQLTYTQKLRRRNIEQEYRDLIEELYADEPHLSS